MKNYVFKSQRYYFKSIITDTIEKTPELFDLFADSFMYGEGEKAIVEMAKYINGELTIDNE